MPSRDAMLQAIRRIWEEGTLITGQHFGERQDGRGFSHATLLRVLENGVVAADPVWNEQHGNWSVTIHGTSVDGETVTVVLGVDLEGSVLHLVTIYG